MARINVEDSLLTDQRFLKLVIKLGSVQYALGVVVWAWRIAQKYFLTTVNDRCIPFNEWKKQGCDDYLIECGLAEKLEQGVKMMGSEDQFKWLLQKQAAGEKSAEVRAKKPKKRAQRSSTDVNGRSTFEHGSEPLSSFLSTLSSSLHNSSSLSSSLISQVIDRVFEIYPKRQGLEGGRKILLEQLKTIRDCEDLQKAVNKYRQYISDPDNAVENVYGFKGFAGVWRQWVPSYEEDRS